MPKFILNIPNVLTLVRLICVPLATLPLLPFFGEPSRLKFGGIVFFFIFAAITDFLDGYFARKLNQTSEWGAYMDPLIDKVLIWFLFAVFMFLPHPAPVWTFLVIILRDVLVTQMRNYAITHHIAFKTSFLAKAKTASQMIAGGIILIYLWISFEYAQKIGISAQDYMTVWDTKISWLANFPNMIIIPISLFTGITGIDYALALYKNIKNNSK